MQVGKLNWTELAVQFSSVRWPAFGFSNLIALFFVYFQGNTRQQLKKTRISQTLITVRTWDYPASGVEMPLTVPIRSRQNELNFYSQCTRQFIPHATSVPTIPQKEDGYNGALSSLASVSGMRFECWRNWWSSKVGHRSPRTRWNEWCWARRTSTMTSFHSQRISRGALRGEQMSWLSRRKTPEASENTQSNLFHRWNG